MTQYWVADVEPNPRFTLYTRGNVGEVFPRVMTALTGTLIGDAVQRGQTELMVELGVLRPHEIVGPSIGTGVFGGYLYMNGSSMRLFGVRMPGMSARDTDEQVMGEVTDLPPYRPAKGDRNLRASLAVSRYVLTMLRSPDLSPLERARAEARAWLATMPDVDTAADEQLLRWLDTYPPRQAASMSRLLRFSGMAAAPRGLLDRFLDRPGVPAGLGQPHRQRHRRRRLGTVAAAAVGARTPRRRRPRPDGRVRRGARGHRDTHLGHAACSRRSTPSSPSTATAAATSTSWQRRRGSWTRQRSTRRSIACGTRRTTATLPSPPLA